MNDDANWFHGSSNQHACRDLSDQMRVTEQGLELRAKGQTTITRIGEHSVHVELAPGEKLAIEFTRVTSEATFVAPTIEWFEV